jgi:hypothetical protein
MIAERHKQFLLGQAHANTVRHSGRTLYTHLCGTHDLLRSWDNDNDVCLAGLFHSIYGTRVFLRRVWSLENRDTIRDLIGPKAEGLVYLFCVLNRPRALIDIKRGGAVGEALLRNYRTMEMVRLSGETISSLQEIEAANLLDQGGRRWLKGLLDCQISNGAARAIDRYLEMKDGLASGDGGERWAAGR